MSSRSSDLIKTKRNSGLQNIINIAKKSDSSYFFEKTVEGILRTEDFIEYLEDRGSKYVFLRGNDDFIEVTIIDDL